MSIKGGAHECRTDIRCDFILRGIYSRPVGDMATLERRVSALEEERNMRWATIDWQFAAHKARLKLTQLYPVVSTQSG